MKDTQDREELVLRLLMRTVGALVVILVATVVIMVGSLVWMAWEESPKLTILGAVGLAIAWKLGAKVTKMIDLNDEDGI